MNKVAILVDGGFYRRVAPKIWGDKTSTERAIDFVLDAMHQPINPDLSEHIDGLISRFKKSELTKNK